MIPVRARFRVWIRRSIVMRRASSQSQRPALGCAWRRCQGVTLALTALSGALAAGPLAAGGDPPSALPMGGQVQVNHIFTADDQDAPAISSLGEDGWFVVWRDRSDTNDRLRSRKLDRAGTPIGNEILVVWSPSVIGNPEVARLDDGRLIAVWPLSNPNLTAAPAGAQGVRGSFVNLAGAAYGSILDIREGESPLVELDVASAPGGGFVVTWVESATVWIRRFDSEGVALGEAVAASTLGTSVQTPRIARLDGGRGHILVWASNGSAGGDASGNSVQWRRLDATGSFAGPEQQANSFTSGHQWYPDVVATIDGGFAIVWHSYPASPANAPEGEPIGDGIDLRFFATDGSPRGPEATISFAPGDAVAKPALVRGPDGDLAATWLLASDSVKARRIVDRHALGPEISVAGSLSASSTDAPAIAADPEGDFAVTWQTIGGSDGDDDDGNSVQARAFTIGRVGHWRFEEGTGTEAFDFAGMNADDASLTGDGIDWSWGRPGSGAVTFVGFGPLIGWADIPPSPDLDIPDAAVTLAAWLYLETPPSEIEEPFASIYDSAQDNYVLYLDRDNAELRFKVTDADGTAERPGIPEAQLPLHRWFHVAGVYRGDSTAAEIHLDGELVDTHINAGLDDPVRTEPAQVAALGRDGVNDRYYFDGRIDEVEVWRRALRGDEIRLVRGPFLYGDGFERGSTLGWSSVVP
jgi:hypothetical protein